MSDPDPTSQAGSATRNPAGSSTGSATATQTQTEQYSVPSSLVSSGHLVLRAEPAEHRHIQWADDVIDNEGMGKKSSKGENSSSEDLKV
jgi:protein phosphatase 1 regulatory subunit 11